ncbi:hypothetical protein KC949_02415 [Candidatus Saccharibacteria bacterium]|nr:hypothetical protein [Candidatus Saccharibacteria bacterium]
MVKQHEATHLGNTDYEVLYTEKDVDRQIKKMASEVINRYAGTDPLFVCLLRGGAPFAMKLMFEITRQDPTFYPEIDYMIVKTYGDRRTESDSELITDLAPHTNTKGRHAIILDDTLDKGITADFVNDHLRKNHQVSDVDLLVLVEKDVERAQFKHATMSCFTAGPEWLVGMGLDDSASGKEAGRWADYVAVLNNNS